MNVDPRFQIEYASPKKTKHFEEYDTAPEQTSLFVALTKQKENERVSDGEKTGIELF